MDVALRKCQPEDLDGLLPYVFAFHAFENVKMPDRKRRDAIAGLLENQQLGGIWWIEKFGRDIGYIALCYGYSIELAGRDAFIDEFFLVEEERGKGIGGHILEQIKVIAKDIGIETLHLEVGQENVKAQRLYSRCGFVARRKYFLMSAQCL